MRRAISFIIMIMVAVSGAMVMLGMGKGVDGELLNGDILTTRLPILITGNSDLTSTNGVSSGSGSISDPYIIENWKISASSINAITISDTNAHLVIRNCWIKDGRETGEAYMFDAMRLENVKNLTISNCLLENNYRGVSGSGCQQIILNNNTCNGNADGISFREGGRNITISSNSFSNNGVGIELETDVDYCHLANNTILRSRVAGIMVDFDCENNIIEYNNCTETYDDLIKNDRSGEGIRIYESSNNIIRYNNCSGNSGRGISIQESDENLMSGNILMDNKATGDGFNMFGVVLTGSKNNILKDNTFIDCGIRFYPYDINETITNTIESTNKINGKDILFMTESRTEETITGDLGQVILVNCEHKWIKDMSFDGVSPGVTIIESFGIEVSNVDFLNVVEAIVVEKSQGISIWEIEITNFGYGIQFDECSLSGVYNSTMRSGTDGIHCIGIFNSTIEYDELLNVETGIWVGELDPSSDVLIKENKVSGGKLGIWVDGGRHRVLRNLIDSNTERGLGIMGEDIMISQNQILGNGYGIRAEYNTAAVIERNVIMWNDVGIYSENNKVQLLITKNNISNNDGYALDFYYDQINGNTIYLNSFHNNNNGGIQARDRGQRSIWDNGTDKGNYWIDYKDRYVPGATNDGTVWDTPYIVAGGTWSKDNYPLVSSPISLPKMLRVSRNHRTTAPIGKDYMVQYTALYSGDRLDNITWNFNTDAGWLSFTGEHVLEGRPSQSDTGSYWANISVTDGVLSDFTNFTVKVTEVNIRPRITTANKTSVDQWQRYRVDYDAVDDGDYLEWRLVTEASFLSIDSQTGVLSGVPGLNDVGTFFVNVSVNDGELWDEAIFYLRVKDVNDPPMQNASRPYLTLLEDTPLKIPMSQLFFNYDNDPMSFFISGGTKINASIDNGSNLDIVPDADWFGTDELTFNVSDGFYNKTFVIDVIVQPVNDAPRDLRISFASIDLVEGGNQIVSAEYLDPDIDDGANVSWYIDGILVSNALTFNLSLPEGNYSLTLRITDSHGNYTEITVPIMVEGQVSIPRENETDRTWLLFLLLPFIALLAIGVVIYILRRRSRVENAGEEPAPSARSSIGRKAPGPPSLELEPRTSMRVDRIMTGHLEYPDEIEEEPIMESIENPWSRRFDDELHEIMEEALKDGISLRDDIAISALIKRLKRKHLDGELSKGDYRRLRSGLERILEE
ncbi:MAG: right-handed parallel beta-helix repeat-containing protein [Candidatus Thermoplasmatota archaeon]|nr:right-handed parallel beta-helix repeat-containing protein [Candidatus Thermoplasmatota archaeon]